MAAGKNGGGVSDFASRVGHGDDQFAVDPSDGEQKRAADGEAQERAEGAAAQQPVVHDDEPADADHGAPAQGEVVGGAQFAGECVHGGRESSDSEGTRVHEGHLEDQKPSFPFGQLIVRSGANYKAFCGVLWFEFRVDIRSNSYKENRHASL